MVREILKDRSKINIRATNDKDKSMLQLALSTSRANTNRAKMAKIGSIVRALCEAGAEVDRKDKHGSAPIHVCAKNMNSDAAMALLDHGAQPDLKDKSGRTALYLIALDNDPDLGFVKGLIERDSTLAGKKLPLLQDRARESQIAARDEILSIGR
jgi:ankyrin repeat protein